MISKYANIFPFHVVLFLLLIFPTRSQGIFIIEEIGWFDMNYTGTRWHLTRIMGNVPQGITVQITNPNSWRGHKFREIAREDSITIQYVHNSCNYLHSFYSRIWSMNLLLYAQPYLHQRIKSTRNKTLSLSLSSLIFFSLRYLPSHINLLNRGQWRGRAAAGENSFTVKKWLEAKKTHHFQHILVLARIRRASAIFSYWQAINPTSYTLFFFFLPFFFLFLSSPPISMYNIFYVKQRMGSARRSSSYRSIAQWTVKWNH